MVSVDGDTSTNDMVAVLANGLAGNAEITAPGADFTAFCRALNSVTVWLCRRIAGDGEGATRLIECCVTGAEDHGDGENRRQEHRLLVARQGRHVRRRRQLGPRAVRHRLQRHACGRAQGRRRSSARQPERCACAHTVRACRFPRTEAKQILLEKEIEILVDLNAGDEGATAWGCDLTYDYVKINGDYRT